MTRHTEDHTESGAYEIRLQGHLDERWSAWFEGFDLVHERGSTTVICCPALDQAALHGLLRKVRDVGLPLISVGRLGTDHKTPND